jgi:purine-nucleoside phosphorylase
LSGDDALRAEEALGAGEALIDVDAAAEFLRQRLPFTPSVQVILGSGLGHLVTQLSDATTVSFAEVPGFPPSGVEGHSGSYVAGHLDGTPVLLQAGRYHAYEGQANAVVVAPVRVAAALGVRVLIASNAAGAIDGRLRPGDLLLIEDQINLAFRSPLAGSVYAEEQRFPDMSAPYDLALQRLTLEVAADLGIKLARGTYAAVLGPSYETAAEVRMIVRLGASVVGMSTVSEVTVARAAGLRCLGFSMITNEGTGLSPEPIGHEEVLEVGRVAGARLGILLSGIVGRLKATGYSGESTTGYSGDTE